MSGNISLGIWVHDFSFAPSSAVVQAADRSTIHVLSRLCTEVRTSTTITPLTDGVQ